MQPGVGPRVARWRVIATVSANVTPHLALKVLADDYPRRCGVGLEKLLGHEAGDVRVPVLQHGKCAPGELHHAHSGDGTHLQVFTTTEYVHLKSHAYLEEIQCVVCFAEGFASMLPIIRTALGRMRVKGESESPSEVPSVMRQEK